MADREALLAAGCARIYTPRDYDLTAIMADIVGLVDSGFASDRIGG